MNDKDRFNILQVTTLASVAVIILLEGVLSDQRVFPHPGFHWALIAVSALSIIGTLFCSKYGAEVFHLPPPRWDLKLTIWILYVLDLISLAYLIFYSGGLSHSPYTAFLLLMPTNGILMEQRWGTVAKYFGFLIPIAGVLAFWSADWAIPPQKLWIYDSAHLASFLVVLILAAVGYAMASKAKEQKSGV